MEPRILETRRVTAGLQPNCTSYQDGEWTTRQPPRRQSECELLRRPIAIEMEEEGDIRENGTG